MDAKEHAAVLYSRSGQEWHQLYVIFRETDAPESAVKAAEQSAINYGRARKLRGLEG